MILKTRAKAEYRDCFPFLLHLLSCALSADTPKVPEGFDDWESLLSLAQFHSVAGAVSFAVSSLPADKQPPENVNSLFSQYKGLSVVSDINLSVETDKLLKALSERGVRVIPVKGYVLKNDYPVPAMRSMTDVDIVFDGNKKQLVKEVFAEYGYLSDESAMELDFTKDDLFHYELHGITENTADISHTYFPDILSRAVYADDSLIGRLTDEDLYLYILSHLSKHMMAGGAGVRMIMDIYVFNKAHGEKLNREYLEKELNKLGLAEFEEKIRLLSLNWFSGETSVTDSLLADFILCACTFGVSKDSLLQSKLKDEKATGKQSTPARSVIKKIFPSCRELSDLYPVIRKHKILYPFCIVAFWFSRVFKKQNINTDNLKYYLTSADPDEAHRMRAIMNEAGLSSFL